MIKTSPYSFEALKAALADDRVKVKLNGSQLIFTAGLNRVSFFLADEHYDFDAHTRHPFIAVDYLVTAPEKIAAMVLSKLKLNKSVFARNCELKKLDKKTAEQFAECYHLMGTTQSAYNLGLYFNNELLAMASFSKGRKMNRLKENKRSFELIRFCCKRGVSVTGGLTKLIKNFVLEKHAGDIMTYIDKQWGAGESFLKVGFKPHSETGPHYFLINRNTCERHTLKHATEKFDTTKFYLTQNLGNLKLVYTPKTTVD